jgi:NAD(P)-dependent dehydrogenase (short-subunit alcohol dehydrogenase family)
MSCRRLEGKVAIVTGGGGGIGSATSERLVDEGARVLVADILDEKAQAVADRLGDAASAFQFDAANPESVRAMVEEAVARFGRLDILHNNAAAIGPDVMPHDTDATDIDFEVWDHVLAVNLRGYLAGCKYAIPHMVRGGGGAIVQMSSGGGLAGSDDLIAYGVSKAAIISLTQYVATRYGKQGIRCNAIAPGLILTETARRNVPELVTLLLKHTLTPHLGEPQDIAALTCFLASDDARYVTGQVICCDGGLLAHQPHLGDVREQQGDGS